MTDSVLEQARGVRSQAVEQLRTVQATRPASGAGPQAQARWLRDKASVHDQIAGHLRLIGDVSGAVEAEVLASRCRLDARDLTADSAAQPSSIDPDRGWELTSTGCPWGPVSRGDLQLADGIEDVPLTTCGPGLP
jgi:hypothetical protein